MMDMNSAQGLLVGPFAFALLMFLWGGWTDIRTMRIPNLVSLGLILAWVARALLAPGSVSLVGDLVFAVLVFIPFFGLYAMGNGGFGAGDVKLITTGTLWFGWGSADINSYLGFLAGGKPPMGMVFLCAMGVAGLFQSLYAIMRQRQIDRRRNGAPVSGLISRWRAIFTRGADGDLHVSSAIAVGIAGVIDDASKAIGKFQIFSEVDGKLKVPYGPSIVAGALVAFWAQLVTWGILS